MNKGRFFGRLWGLGAACLICLALWWKAWAWIGGRAPLQSYTGSGWVSVSGGEGNFFLASGITQAFVLAFASLLLSRHWPKALDFRFREFVAKPRIAYFSLACVGAVVAFCIALAAVGFQPLSEEEKTYIFQAKLLLLGRLTVPMPPESSALIQPFLIQRDGLLTGPFHWAQPAMIAVGLMLRVPHIVTAIQVGVTVFFACKLAEEYLSDVRAGVLAGFLVASSPLLITSGSTLHNASLRAACAITSAWACTRLANRRDPRAALVLGLASGVGIHCHIGDQLIIVGVCGFAIASRCRWSISETLRRLALSLVVCAPFIALHPVINYLVSGRWWNSGLSLLASDDRWIKNGPLLGFMQTPPSWEMASAKTFSSAVRLAFHANGAPYLLLLLGAPVLGLLRGSLRLMPLALMALFCFLVQSLTEGLSIGTPGPVDYAPTVVFLLVSLAVVAVRLHTRLKESRPSRGRIIPALALAQALAALLVFWPSVLAELGRSSEEASRCPRLMHWRDVSRGLVFYAKPGKQPRQTWAFGAPMTSPRFDDPILYVPLQSNEENARVAQAFAGDRPVYVAECLLASPMSLSRYDPSTGRVSDARLEGPQVPTGEGTRVGP